MDFEKRSGRTLATEANYGLLDNEDEDIESQPFHEVRSQTPVEYAVPTSKKLLFLTLYFILNLGITLSNKALLRAVSFPWLLTFSHTLSTSFGCALLAATGQLKLTTLAGRDILTLLAFSVLFTLNIAISNVTLALVSVPFHQIVRSTCPIATILIYRVVYNRTYSTETYMSVVPLILGVALATYGVYYFTHVGFLFALLGVLLASVKTVATNRLMTGSLNLCAMEVLLRMSPLAAAQCLVYAASRGEISRLLIAIDEGIFEPRIIIAVIVNGAMAFALNLVSFRTNKVAGALTISVCGNVKQCLTILLGIILFRVEITPLNGAGMLIAMAGAAYYSKVELDRNKTESE